MPTSTYIILSWDWIQSWKSILNSCAARKYLENLHSLYDKSTQPGTSARNSTARYHTKSIFCSHLIGTINFQLFSTPQHLCTTQ